MRRIALAFLLALLAGAAPPPRVYSAESSSA